MHVKAYFIGRVCSILDVQQLEEDSEATIEASTAEAGDLNLAFKRFKMNSAHWREPHKVGSQYCRPLTSTPETLHRCL